MMSAMFVTGGIDGLRNPGPRIEAATNAGLDNAVQLVRVNAVVSLLGGLSLATGRLPRLSALALAGTLVPATYVGHAFWTEKDQESKQQQRMHFVKNVSMLGGLLLAVADTGGRESIPHAAGRVTRRARKRAAKAAAAANKKRA